MICTLGKDIYIDVAAVVILQLNWKYQKKKA
jgi:hypothetical protein